MEESEKRRERLKALQMEAAEAEVSNSQHSSTPPGSLLNPLLDPPILPSPAENSPAVPRFDFYTDPVSAFSGNRKRSKDSIHGSLESPPMSSCSLMGQLPMPYSGPRSPSASPASGHQFRMNSTPAHRAYQAPPSHTSTPWRSPIRMASPFPGHIGTPGTWNQSGGTPSYGFPQPHSSRVVLSTPGCGRGGSFSPNQGRGSYNRFNRSPGSGWSSGRCRGFHAQEQPERFYHKSMMEDPWQFLAPMVRSLVTTVQNPNADSPRSWLPRSISGKKARIS